MTTNDNMTLLLDDAVEHTGKVDLRWQQPEVVGKPNTITQLFKSVNV